MFVLYTLFKELGTVDQIKQYFFPKKKQSDTGATASPLSTTEASEDDIFDLNLPSSSNDRSMTISIKKRDSNSLLATDNFGNLNQFLDFNPGSGKFGDGGFDGHNVSRIGDVSRNTIAVMEKSKKKAKVKRAQVDEDDEAFEKAIFV